jgi:hypothetical protein
MQTLQVSRSQKAEDEKKETNPSRQATMQGGGRKADIRRSVHPVALIA